MRLFIHITAIALAALAVSCGTGAPAEEGGNVRELIGDGRFERGLALSPRTPQMVNEGGGFAKTNVDTLRFVPCDEPPVWQACQWATRHSLAGAEAKRVNGGVEFANEGKRLRRSKDGALVMEVFGSKEYDAPRTASQPWLHLLIQQDFPDAPRMGELEALRLRLQLRLLHCENRLGEAYDSSIHTAHTPFYLIIRNTNPHSADHGQWLWVGFQSFDYRHERLSEQEGVQWDIDTKTYIYTAPTRQIWGDISFHDGQPHATDTDLLPILHHAVDVLRSHGYFLNSTPDDLSITGMNFGWEVPGTFDAAIEFKGMSLQAVMKPKAEPKRVRLQTTAGDVVVELSDLTPRHRDNFVALVEEGYFDSLLFHRVIENFMIQGGDPRTRRISGAEFDAEAPETGDARYWEDIDAEIRFPALHHRRGALAAAREGDDVNPLRRSSRTQFYIVWGRTFSDEELDRQQERVAKATEGRVVLPDSIREVYRTVGGTPHLDGQYTVFGHVVEGLDVVEAIQRTPTDSLDRPMEDVRIIRAEVISNKDKATK